MFFGEVLEFFGVVGGFSVLFRVLFFYLFGGVGRYFFVLGSFCLFVSGFFKILFDFPALCRALGQEQGCLLCFRDSGQRFGSPHSYLFTVLGKGFFCKTKPFKQLMPIRPADSPAPGHGLSSAGL